MKVREIFNVPTEGAGREDYSLSIEISPIPVIRGYQEPAKYSYTFRNVAPGETKTHETEEFDYSHFIFNVYVSASANVLIKANIYGYNKRTEEWIHHYTLMGYQLIEHKIGVGYPISKMKVEVTNFGDVVVDIIYSHIGVKGIEKIYPWFAEVGGW